MPSKMVIRQHDTIVSIGSAAIKNAEALAAKLSARLDGSAQQAGAAPTDWKAILEDVGQFLVDSGNGLIEKDQQLQEQRRFERQYRFQRDEAANQIRIQLRGVRFLADEAFGLKRARLVFPAAGELARLPARTLLRVAQEAVAMLQGSGIVWPSVESLGHAAPPAQILAGLVQAIPSLEAALDGLRPEVRGAEHALGNKVRDYNATVEAMRRGADFLFGLFRMAEFDIEAERLRPRRRRAVKVPEVMEGAMPAPEVGPMQAAAALPS